MDIFERRGQDIRHLVSGGRDTLQSHAVHVSEPALWTASVNHLPIADSPS